MASAALQRWDAKAIPRLDELERVHATISGGGRGRRWGTTQLNRSLFLALVAQFQSYCRDLHDLAVGVHVGAATPGQSTMLQTVLTQRRKLDVGNPRTASLAEDFGRLGFVFVPALKAEGAYTVRRLEMLDVLVNFRNAVAHGDDTKLAALEASGAIKSTKPSYDAHRRAIDALARTMDAVVARRLAAVLGTSAPW